MSEKKQDQELDLVAEDITVEELQDEQVVENVEVSDEETTDVVAEDADSVEEATDAEKEVNGEKQAQLLFQGLSRLFDLLTIHDNQCNVFKFLISGMVEQVFEGSLRSVHLVLILNKVMSHMNSLNVFSTERFTC